MSQQYAQKQTSKTDRPADETVEAAQPNTELAESTEEVLAGIDDLLDELSDDDLLDEIDDVLEENAEEFVRGFVQQGGE